MGLRGRQVLFRTLTPVALPLILLGLRLAAIQVVSTATVAAFVGLGGLGRFIIDGLATKTYADVVGERSWWPRSPWPSSSPSSCSTG